MARRKFRNQRHEPATERSFQEYIYSTAAPLTSRTELMRLVRGGEDTYLELKVKLSNSEKIAQGIVALANTGGGVIVFGVNDQMRVEGVEDSEDVQEELVRICREDIQPPLIPFIDRVAFDNGRRIVVLDVEGKPMADTWLYLKRPPPTGGECTRDRGQPCAARRRANGRRRG